MGLKTKLGLAVVTSAVGAALVAGGSFALFTAQATNNNNTFAAGTVKIGASSGKIFAGTQYVGNMAPGDSETGTLTVSNTGSLDEWVGLEHKLSGSIFNNYLISVDRDAGIGGQPGTGLDYLTDLHPLQISYSIQVKGADGKPVGNPITRGAFSTSDGDPVSSFKLLVGQTADITYTYKLPLEAHNDYQANTGRVDVELDAVQVRNNDGANGPQSWNPDIHG